MPFSTNVIYFASEGPPACNEPDRENRQCRKMSSVVALERPFKLRLSIHPFSDILFFTPMTSWKVWWNKRLLMVGSVWKLFMCQLKIIKIFQWMALFVLMIVHLSRAKMHRGLTADAPSFCLDAFIGLPSGFAKRIRLSEFSSGSEQIQLRPWCTL